MTKQQALTAVAKKDCETRRLFLTTSTIGQKFSRFSLLGEGSVVEPNAVSANARKFKSPAERLIPIEHVPVKIVTMREGLVVMADAADQPCWG